MEHVYRTPVVYILTTSLPSLNRSSRFYEDPSIHRFRHVQSENVNDATEED